MTKVKVKRRHPQALSRRRPGPQLRIFHVAPREGTLQASPFLPKGVGLLAMFAASTCIWALLVIALRNL